MAFFDNIEDVQAKFLNTIVLYNKEAVMVKAAVMGDGDEHDYRLSIVGDGSPRGKYIKLRDPGLNYTNFRLGYAQHGAHAAWWFRKPQRQYHQGLKANQLGVAVSGYQDGEHLANFNFSSPYIKMIEGKYPNVKQCMVMLQQDAYKVAAFHPDFAISFDKMHEDYTIEYRSTNIGISHDFTGFKILDEHKHLTEALKEAVNV